MSSRTPSGRTSRAIAVPAILAVAVGVMAIGVLAWIPARAASPPGAANPSPAVVTARPPLEAVPVTPGARAQQARLRHCTVAARARHLRGKARDTYIRNCAVPARPAPATPSRSPSRSPSQPLTPP